MKPGSFLPLKALQTELTCLTALLNLFRRERADLFAAMDVNLWSSRPSSAKYFSAVQAGLLHPDDQIVLDDSEGDDNSRAHFSCSFCYVDIEVPSLCIHLEDEHCFDLRNAVCPLCAANLGKDATGHFIAHHPTSLKRRKRPEKSAIPALLAKKVQMKRGESKIESSPDLLFALFICSVPFSDPKEENSRLPSSSADNKFRSVQTWSLNHEDEENAEKRQRAEFVQELIVSTISWSQSESQHF